MPKENRGITLIALVITIIVLIILASITTYSGLDTIRNARYYNAVSELKVIQAKVNEMYEDYKNGNEKEQEKILNQGQSISDSGIEQEAYIAYNSVEKNNLNKTDIGKFQDYRYYSVDYIENDLDIEGISLDFIINIKARSVILLNAIKMEGKNFYALCEIKGEQYNVKYENET